MREKNHLYKKLLDTAPYGTLFFAYGVCIDANPKALSILGCNRSEIIGISLFERLRQQKESVAQLRRVVGKVVDEQRKGILWRSRNVLEDDEVLLAMEEIEGSDSAFSLMLFPMPAFAEMMAEEFDTSQLEAYETSSNAGADVNAPPKQVESQKPLGSVLETVNVEEVADESATATVNTESDTADSEFDILANQEPLLFGNRVKDQVESRSDVTHSETDAPEVDNEVTGLPASQEMMGSISTYLDLYRDDNACGALLLIDLDHFNSINESLGKQIGSQILEKANATIQGMLTDNMEVDRVAGDAFLLFIKDLAKTPGEAKDVALSIANEIRRIISRPFFTENGEVIVTASVGISLLFERLTTAEQAVQQSESAMFEAKRRGRDSVVMFDSQITRQAQQRINLQSSLRKAVANQEFDLYLQPQVSLRSGEVIGGEVLLRWLHPGHAMHTPADFIPVLEASGMIVDVGQWVFRTSCEYLRNMLDSGIWNEDMRMGVNISPRQFHDPNLIQSLEHSLKSYDIRSDMLTLEVTENLLIDDFEHVVDKMKKIRDMGVHFSIDDFGSGYSSMIYLKRLPLDSLKIDREFVANIHSDKDTMGLVEAIMMVSRHYGLDVVAEGVEKREALEVLRSLGCDAYQGAHFSMPVPMDKFQQILSAA